TTYPGYKDNEDFEVLRYFSVPIFFRPPYRYGFPKLDKRFKKRISEVKFDLVHAHSPFVAGSLALEIARERNVPFVASFHTKYHDAFKHIFSSKRLIRHFIKRIVEFYESADDVWVPNSGTIITLREYGYKGNVFVMPNGTDLQSIKGKKPCIKTVDTILKVDDAAPVFLFVGQLTWEKNHKFLLKSLKLLREKGFTNFLMVFIGAGYAEQEMKNIVKDYNIEKNVTFLGVIKDREKLKTFFLRADLMLFPSLYDTSPLTLKEAAALKLPVLLIENSTASEGITDNYNGFLSPDDPEKYARKILSVIKNKKLIDTAGENAQRTLYHSWEEVIEKVYEKYSEIIKKHKFLSNTK
ncbi:MAG: glycosyltransferase family 4 protein, partial [Spirochaetes bacterium]|nr:glycosyltransferase family 4 protein [Spirochaetota bacterium]